MINKKKNKGKIGGRGNFLFAMIAIYIIVAFFSFEFVKEALKKTLITLWKITPILGAVFIIMILINLYLESGKIKKHLEKELGWRGWFYSIIAGILISGPPYVFFPMLGEMKKHGMKNSLIAVFLYNRNVKIPYLHVSIYYFGLPFTLIVSLYIIIFSILNGIIVSWLSEDKTERNFS